MVTGTWLPIWSIWALPLLFLCVAVALFLAPSARIYFTPSGRRIKKLINSIPGPPHLPVIGNTLDFWVSRERILEYRRNNCVKYFPLYKLWYFDRYMVSPVSPEYIKLVLQSSKHIEKGWLYHLLHPWLGSGLLTSKGEKWFSHRKLLTPAFHFKILEEFVPMFAERSAALVDKLSVEAVTGKPFDIVPVISQCTLDIICESAMGIKLDREDEEQRNYIAAIYGFGEVIYHRAISPWYAMDWLFALTPLARRQRQLLKILHSFTEKVVKDKKREYWKIKSQKRQRVDEARRASEKKKVKAFLELLLELSMEDNVLTDKEIREEVDTFMFEGHDTTSMAICWTIFMLANHPTIQEQVWEEVEALTKRQNASPADRDVESQARYFNDMYLLERCIKETLRMYPSVPFITRVLCDDLKMGEYLIPAGSTINLAISGIHMNPTIYTDPDTFDPDRFLPEIIRTRHPYAYIPFSAGPRNCIGQRFALLEIKAVISSLIRRFKLTAVDKPEDVTFMHDLVLRPSGGIKIRLEPRGGA